MFTFRNNSFFSLNGEYFAYSTPDGCLKIWETSSNRLKQDYTPSSHLSAKCSTLSWGPSKINHSSKKLKSENKGIFSTVIELQLIALGTLTGDVLLYSITKGDLYSHLNGGHSNTINDICWYAERDSLFTCSNDNHIVIWSISTGKIKLKWKAATSPIYSISVVDEKSLLSGSNAILWWNLEDQTIIKKFIGHPTEVVCLLPVRTPTSFYFLSSAMEDRLIHAWHLKENETTKPVASFILSDEPKAIEICNVLKPNEPLIISVVTQDGNFVLFHHTFNGKTSKPLEPKTSIHIISQNKDAKLKTHTVPILAAKFMENIQSCLLAYGNFLHPTFENMNLSDCPEDLYLIRNITLSSYVSIEDGISKIKEPDKSDVKMLAPAHMTPLKSQIILKRKHWEQDMKELSIEEKLKDLEVRKPSCSTSTVKTDSLVHLLVQGLQSQDTNLLNTVFQCNDEVIIFNTLKKLPVRCIPLVLKELHKRLLKKETLMNPTTKWLKGITTTHISFFMSCKDIDEYIGPICQLLEVSQEFFLPACHMTKMLKILLNQAKIDNETKSELYSEPLFSHYSESSDENEDKESETNSMSEDEVLSNESISSDEDEKISDY